MADAIILAGGLGTRLREVVPDLPKPLALIQGVAFLDLLLLQLEQATVIDRIILAIGYKADAVVERYRDKKRKLPIDFSIETELLGTGGAVKRALQYSTSSPVFVLNGDSYLNCPFEIMFEKFRAPVTIAYTHVENASRYGQIEVDASGRIHAFHEKAATDRPGNINGGIYLFERSIFENQLDVFSLEKDLLPDVINKGVYGFSTAGLFIDIGTPVSFVQAQDLLKPLIRE